MAGGSEKASWSFEQGDEIVAGRSALEFIGGGEMCETWLAWDAEMLAVVVVKIIRPDRNEDESSLRSLRLEAEALEQLAHPAILRSFGAVLEPPRAHIVLEHLEGPNLRSLVRRYGAQPLEQLLPLALHVCAALHYMHGRGMVHLDVKSRNIVMGAQPRLIDMSIARSTVKAAKLTYQVGTAAYMAPEQCDPEGLGPVGPPADVWGLGVTLFEAVAGERPFATGVDDDDAPLTEQYPQMTEPPPVLPRETPYQLIDVLMACLEPAPEERPTPAEVALALEPLVAGIPRADLGPRRRPRLWERGW